MADDHVRRAHSAGHNRRHAPRFARIGAIAPEHQRTVGDITPYHRRISAPLDNSIVHPRYGFSIDDVNASVKTVVGSDDNTFIPGLTLAQLSTKSATAMAACFGISGIELTIASDIYDRSKC